ncbi:hypothetical protein Flavo103_36810 [Flavobacterium collinsii]|uniref:hypothetical protein n=1 Tax=Flavobacterium collinsii TaxID=1114861 RepID=UPI0022C87646|nr:hypothetical protein [Flavobacterium collinsii]GIQ60545.1 hypothetical protein Flavo103_36810 [Flavobacterium collinsii]
MAENSPDIKVWAIGTTIILMIDRYELVLMGVNDSATGLTKFSGEVNFFDNPISIRNLINRFLSNFNLTLPESVPDITFNSFGGSAVLSPKDKKNYRFYAESKIILPNPFGLSNNALSFDNLKLALNRSVKISPVSPKKDEEWDTSVSVSTDISYVPGGTSTDPITFGSGNFYFASGGNYALSLFITKEIDPAGIIEDLISITIPAEVKTFLPIFKPEAPDKPIRLYKASSDFTFQNVEEDGSLFPIHFNKGFNLDQLDIEIVNTNFLVAMSIVNDTFSISAQSESIKLFGLVEVIKKSTSITSATGPGLIVVSNTKSITLFGGLKFFPDSETPEILDFDFTYSNKTNEFSGDLTYQGTIIGQRNPGLGFAWKKTGGFRITKFPFNQDALSKAMDWGKKIKDFANASKDECAEKCGELVDLAFNELITTSYDLKFTPGSSSKKGYVQISVEGTYKIAAVGKSVSNITFSPINFEIKIPTSFDNLAEAICDSLIASSEKLAEGLWNNKAQITEFFTFITIKNVTESQACRLACKVGREVLKKAFEDLLKSVAGNTLVAAAEAVAAAIGVLAAIASAVKWLVDALSGKKSEAERQKEENTNRIQNELLAIDNMAATYYQENGIDKYIEVNWDDIPGKDSGGGEVYYIMSWAYSEITKSRRIARNDTGSTYTQNLQRDEFQNGVAVVITVKAYFNYNGESYSSNNPGKATVNTPILQTPVPIPKTIDLQKIWVTEQQKKLGIIDISWASVHVIPVNPPNPVTCFEYNISLWNTSTNTKLKEQTLVLPAKSLAVTFDLYKDTIPVTPLDQRFMPNPEHLFQIKINAMATDPDLNSLTGTSDKFKIPWGIGYVRVGYNFKIE